MEVTEPRRLQWLTVAVAIALTVLIGMVWSWGLVFAGGGCNTSINCQDHWEQAAIGCFITETALIVGCAVMARRLRAEMRRWAVWFLLAPVAALLLGFAWSAAIESVLAG